ncbi:MAG: universal stress protein [Candidatus Tumulicola sp.]
MNGRILIPVDGSEQSLRALDVAADLASALRATLIVCHVADIARVAAMTFGEPQFAQECFDAVRAEGASMLKEAVERAQRRVDGVESQIGRGNVVDEILRLATEAGAEWIVMGSHGRSGLSRLLMGSVAEGVLRHSTVPVMIVPPDRQSRKRPHVPAGAEARPL